MTDPALAALLLVGWAVIGYAFYRKQFPKGFDDDTARAERARKQRLERRRLFPLPPRRPRG